MPVLALCCFADVFFLALYLWDGQWNCTNLTALWCRERHQALCKSVVMLSLMLVVQYSTFMGYSDFCVSRTEYRKKKKQKEMIILFYIVS